MYNFYMLKSINIKNIVLIENLNLEFCPKLTVLTGETGAGKSILMDALALSLGARSEAGLVRTGAESGQVISEFQIDDSPKIKTILDEQGIDSDDSIILRRTIAKDGKSKAWINDIPVTIKTLKTIGDMLVEIHGQFENHTLLDSSSHIGVLDDFGGLNELKSQISSAYYDWKNVIKVRDEFQKHLENIEKERDYLEYNIAELEKINPIKGEEEALSNQRLSMMNSEKNLDVIKDAVGVLQNDGRSADSIVFNSARLLEKLKTEPNPAEKIIEKLYNAGELLAEANDELEVLYKNNIISEEDLESAEERLFALRALSRKHKVSVDELADYLTKMKNDLSEIEIGTEKLVDLNKNIDTKYEVFFNLAKKLSETRQKTATVMRSNLMKELPDLKLENSDFQIKIEQIEPSFSGIDSVCFMISTNPGVPLAPLNKVASGGELSRLMLALRVILSKNNPVNTFVFDEIDTGISGAIAEAIGERLNRLSDENQVLVITHSAQVAGFGYNHLKISKSSENNSTKTFVRCLTGEERVLEIARIISGSDISEDSLRASKKLIKN